MIYYYFIMKIEEYKIERKVDLDREFNIFFLVFLEKGRFIELYSRFIFKRLVYVFDKYINIIKYIKIIYNFIIYYKY